MAISATSRRRSSPVRRTRPRPSSSSTRSRRTWAIPRPACSRSGSNRAYRSSPSSTWAAATCSTSPSGRARRPKSLKDLEGKTILLGSAGWQSICDPMLYAAGVDMKKVKYVEAGWPTWGTALKAGKGDAALVLGRLARAVERPGPRLRLLSSARTFRSCRPTASSSARRISRIRRKQKLYARYLQGWAAGLEFGKQNPRAATQIVMMQFPGLASQMNPTRGDRVDDAACQRLRRPHGRAQEVGLPPAVELGAFLRHGAEDRADHQRPSSSRTSARTT